MPKIKKILCINYEYPPIGGGGGVVCKGLAEALVQMGYKIDVVTSGMKRLPWYEEIEGVKVHRVRSLRRFRHYVTTPEMITLILPLYFKALKLVRENSYDLNHTHFVVPSGIIAYMLWRKTGLPYIITSHGSDIPGYNPDRFDSEHKLISLLWKRIINNSVILTAPSHFLKQLIQTKIDTPIEVIPNGNHFSTNSKRDKKNRILVVTRMFERKGVQHFIKSIVDLRTEWEILIAGDGPYLPKLKAMAENIPSIKFLGFVQRSKLLELYQSAKIFVFPSIQENFPVVLLEAMAAGCAIITTSAHGCAEVVGNAAIKTLPGSSEDIKEALELLMNDEQKIEQLARLSQDRAEKFSWPVISCKFDSLFKNVDLPKQ